MGSNKRVTVKELDRENGNHTMPSTQERLSKPENIVEIRYDERNVEWYAEIARVFGGPENLLTPKSGSLSGQEGAYYYLPKTRKSAFDPEFDGIVLYVTRDFDYQDPYFKVHIRFRKPGQPERILFNADVVSIWIKKNNAKKECSYVDFRMNAHNKEQLFARVFLSGKVTQEEESVS